MKSRFPTPEEIVVLNRVVTERLGLEAGDVDVTMIRAILLGVRIARRGKEVHTDRTLRAAVLLREIVKTRPFAAGNSATALAAAALYLERHGGVLEISPEQAADLVAHIRDGSDDQDATARKVEARVRSEVIPGR